jgi:UDP-N-acetylmuramoyl-L-alanyl-D-glutamate--2,6-diaminopimelate ligase
VKESRGSGVSARKWKEWVGHLPAAELEAEGSLLVSGMAYDSRRVRPGDAFVALPGALTDGTRYIEDAIRRGAVAILHEGRVHLPKGVAGARVENARAAMADLAAVMYGHPSEDLTVIGVTGTNGKTTTTFMIRHLLQSSGIPTGLIGTIQYEIGRRCVMAERTTPESLDLQNMLREMRLAGCKAVAMEVSSQGIMAQRIRAVHFGAAVFTNLSQDHLDFHHTMEAYFAAKKRLFSQLCEQAAATAAIFNIDDPYGRELAADAAFRHRGITYGTSAEAMVRASKIISSAREISFEVKTPWGAQAIHLPLAGRHNVYNALAAMAVAGAMRIPPAQWAEGLATLPPIPGRLERVDDPIGGRHIFVDYAHSEDALRKVLQTLRETTEGRLICVFGCGGNRDATKRARMGAVVAEWADWAVLTNDNPRHENPADILSAICAGMPVAGRYMVEEDRASAIRLALQNARAGDTVLIAGKGHEPYQEIQGCKIHFDDREQVREFLATEIR